MGRSSQITREQAEQCLAAVKDRYKAWLTDLDGNVDESCEQPKLRMEFAWFGGEPGPAIVWEGGPYEWTMLVHGGIEEEFGFELKPVDFPKQVFVEPITGWALGIYPN